MNMKDKIKLVIREWRAGTAVMAFNFHRIASASDTTPFDRLHTVSSERFRTLLGVFNTLFRTIEQPYPKQYIPGIIISFDDVSRTFMTEALPMLGYYRIPATIFPSVRHTAEGYGWRDMIYYVMKHPDTEHRIICRVIRMMGESEGKRLQQMGIYSWSKQPDIRTSWLEENILKPELNMKEFESQVKTHQPYLNWNNLRMLSENHLITIGNHGFSHYDYRTLSEKDIEQDVIRSHEIFRHELGYDPRHFALPFGASDQRVFLTLDKLLHKLGYKTACWGDGPYLNIIGKAATRVTHLFRINTPNRLGKILISAVRAVSHPHHTPMTIFRNRRLEGQSRVDDSVTEDEYRHIHLLVAPQKHHHQRTDYYDYLFKINPFVPENMPVHLGLRYEGNLEAIASLFYVRFVLKGQPMPGAYYSGWWRMPEIHSPDGTRPLLLKAQEICPILGAYSASVFSGRLFAKEGWKMVSVSLLTGNLRRQAARKPDYRMDETYPSHAGELLNLFNSSADFSVLRDKTYYTWRYDGYPLSKFVYLTDSGRSPGWFAVIGKIRNTLYLSDAVTHPADSEDRWREMLAAISDYSEYIGAETIRIETDSDLLKNISESYGLKLSKTYRNFYYISPSVCEKSDFCGIENIRLHETQATGDVLPR